MFFESDSRTEISNEQKFRNILTDMGELILTEVLINQLTPPGHQTHKNVVNVAKFCEIL